MKQLEDYEEAVMARRLAEMPPDEVDRLMAEVRRFLFAIQSASYAPRTVWKSDCTGSAPCRGLMAEVLRYHLAVWGVEVLFTCLGVAPADQCCCGTMPRMM